MSLLLNLNPAITPFSRIFLYKNPTPMIDVGRKIFFSLYIGLSYIFEGILGIML